MKKTIAFLISFVCLCFSANSQDIITLNTGDELKAQIIRINPKDVTYIKEGNTDTVALDRAEIHKLNYKNGTVVYLSESKRPVMSDEPLADSLYAQGAEDATQQYKGYKAAATGTLIASFYFPWGLVPAIACSSKPPSMQNLGYKDSKKMENSSYYAGYTDQAHKIKKKKVWKNFAIGSGITVGSYLIILASMGAIFLM